jgi:uncharacterized protein YggE
MPNSSSLQTDTVLRWVGVVVLAVLGLFLVAKTVNTFAERDYIGKAVRDRDLITVSGMGSVTAKPDLAKVDVGVFSEGQSVSAVQGDSTSKMNAMIDALKTLGITDADIQTSNYNLQPKIDWSDNKQRVIGYTLTQTVNVKVRDLAKVGDVLESATSHGANQIYGVQFTIDDPTSIQDEARVKAIKEAQKKADALADAVGLHIVKVVSFSEAGGFEPPYPMQYAAGDLASAVKNVAPQIEAGSLDVKMNVSVTFEVR